MCNQQKQPSVFGILGSCKTWPFSRSNSSGSAGRSITHCCQIMNEADTAAAPALAVLFICSANKQLCVQYLQQQQSREHASVFSREHNPRQHTGASSVATIVFHNIQAQPHSSLQSFAHRRTAEQLTGTCAHWFSISAATHHLEGTLPWVVQTASEQATNGLRALRHLERDRSLERRRSNSFQRQSLTSPV